MGEALGARNERPVTSQSCLKSWYRGNDLVVDCRLNDDLV